MPRPTKEEAAWWVGYLQQAQLQGEGLRADQLEGLRVWIERVQAALPSAQAVRRDRERRKKPGRQTHCPVDGVSHGLADKCDACI